MSASLPRAPPPALSLPTELQLYTAQDPWFEDPTNTAGLTRHSSGLWLRTPHPSADAQVVVPNNAVLKHRIISEYHDSNLAAHRGRDATLDLVTRRYWWPSVAKDVSDYVASCPACQHSKQRTGPTPGLLQSLPIPTEPWESVTCDFITGLPRTRKHNDAICVFVDRLTKMVHCIPCRTDITAESTAQLFLQHIVRLHGEPKHIITDRGSTFMASFFQA